MNSVLTAGLPSQRQPCPLCEGRQLRLVVADDIFRSGLQTAICCGCAFVHTNPRPAPASYARFYQEEYRKLYWAGVKNHEQEFEVTRRRENALLELRLRRYAAQLKSADRILDVGAGFALLLRRLKVERPALHAVAVDEDDKLMKALAVATPGVRFHGGDLSSLAEQRGSFDVVIMFHVLEHVADPVAFLVEAADWLTPDGVMLVEVPDIAGPWQGIGMFHPAHVSHFSVSTLARAAASAGLVISDGETWTSYPAVPSLSAVLRRGSGEPIPVDDVDALLLDIQRKVGPTAWKAQAKKQALVALGKVAPALARGLQRRRGQAH